MATNQEDEKYQVEVLQKLTEEKYSDSRTDYYNSPMPKEEALEIHRDTDLKTRVVKIITEEE